MQLNNSGGKKIKNFSYNISAKIGEGSFSKVYIGKNDISFENVAIKVIRMDSLKTQKLLDLLQNEVAVMKQLSHPNIVKLHEVFNTRNNVYIIQEYCEGGDVSNVLKEKGKLPETMAFKILQDILRGFKVILSKGIIHRDIKPANIFISKGFYKLGDFGFAKPVKSLDEKMVTTFIGTPLYMSPQCLQNGAYSTKCDIWSIGITYYQLITGVTPWKCNNHFELLNKIFTEKVLIPQNNQISDWSRYFLMKTLIIDEDHRISWDQIYSDSAFQDQKPVIKELLSDESISTNSEEKFVINIENKSDHLIWSKFSLHLENILQTFNQVKNFHCLTQWLYDKIVFLATKHKSYLLLKLKHSTINGEFDFQRSVKYLNTLISQTQKSENYDFLLFDENFFSHFIDSFTNEDDFLHAIQYYIMMAIRQCNHHIAIKFSENNEDWKTETLMHFLRDLTNYYQALLTINESTEKLDIQRLSHIFSSQVPSFNAESYQKLREKIYFLNI